MSVLENVLVGMHNSMNVNIIDIILKTKNSKEEKLKREKAEKLLEYTGLVKYTNNRASSSLWLSKAIGNSKSFSN